MTEAELRALLHQAKQRKVDARTRGDVDAWIEANAEIGRLSAEIRKAQMAHLATKATP